MLPDLVKVFFFFSPEGIYSLYVQDSISCVVWLVSSLEVIKKFFSPEDIHSLYKSQ